MSTKIAPLESALKQVKDQMNAAISAATPKLRPRLITGRGKVDEALVQVELAMLMNNELPCEEEE